MMSATVPAYYKTLSLGLWRALESVGVTEEIRALRLDSALRREILGYLGAYFEDESTFSFYIVGSSFEGTSTAGLESDTDILYCQDAVEVIEDIQAKPTEAFACLLIVRDNTTKPGYVKLQYVEKGIPQTALPGQEMYLDNFMVDDSNRIVVCRRHYDPGAVDEQHGPADTVNETPAFSASDLVQSFRCRILPKMAQQWIERIKINSLPCQFSLDKMMTLGAFFVPKGHPYSDHREKEWIISFSLQERTIMSSLNPTQHKCYVLLKMIKKDLLFSMLKTDSLSSYHMKTCLMYMIERTSLEFWKPENLFACLQSCLLCLLNWVNDGFFPNYFIPEQNLFDGRVSPQTQTQLKSTLQCLVASDCQFLANIKCDDVGQHFRSFCLKDSNATDNLEFVARKRTYICLTQMRYLTVVRNDILNKATNENINLTVKELFEIVSKLRQTETVTGHTVEETKEATSPFIPYIETYLMSAIAVRQVTISYDDSTALKYIFRDHWKKVNKNSNSITATLKRATYLYMLGYNYLSLKILQLLQKSLNEWKVTHCGCRELSHKCELNNDLVNRMMDANITVNKFVADFASPCVVFLPSEKVLVPAAMKLEMNRSVNMPSESKKKWYNWAVVDSKILLNFLLYVNHKELEMFSLAQKDIAHIEMVLESDLNLGHRETDLNILGWIYKNERSYDKAAHCFKKSLEIQQEHNAAVLNLKELDVLIQNVQAVTVIYSRLA